MKFWGSWYFYFTHTFPFCWHFLLLLSEWLDCFIYTDLVPFLWTLFVSILLLLCVSWENCFPILFLDMPCYPRDKLLIFVLIIAFVNFRFSSVTQLCPTLCEPMNRSTSGLPDHHQLPEFTETHVHRVDAIQPSHPLSFPTPPAPDPSQHQSLFQWVNSSHEVGKVLEFQL